jgi:ketosteroid isomerase-like protein
MNASSPGLDVLMSEREITRLVYNYCHGMDRRDMDLFLGIWTEDAVYATNTAMGRFVGKTEIERGVREAMWPTFEATHHWTVNLVIDITGDTATGISNLTAQCVPGGGGATVVAATYHDEFRRQDGSWLMSKRDIEVHHFAGLEGADWGAPSPHTA